MNNALRIFFMLVLLRPIAFACPRFVGKLSADVLALILMPLKKEGRREYWTIREAYDTGRLAAWIVAWRRVAQTLHTFVMNQRVVYRRKNAASLPIVQTNRESLESLLSSDASFIVATAHFNRFAYIALATREVLPRKLVQAGLAERRVVSSMSDVFRNLRSKNRKQFLRDWRMQIQYGTMLSALQTRRGDDLTLAFVCPENNAAAIIFEHLKSPGNVVNVHVDAPWPKDARGAITRPFAAVSERGFSTGVAQLSKLANCPVVSCVYSLNSKGQVVLEWGDIFRPGDWVDDKEMMNKIVDRMEVAIGLRPDQYGLDIGRGRMWNERKLKWQTGLRRSSNETT